MPWRTMPVYGNGSYTQGQLGPQRSCCRGHCCANIDIDCQMISESYVTCVGPEAMLGGARCDTQRPPVAGFWKKTRNNTIQAIFKSANLRCTYAHLTASIKSVVPTT